MDWHLEESTSRTMQGAKSHYACRFKTDADQNNKWQVDGRLNLTCIVLSRHVVESQCAEGQGQRSLVDTALGPVQYVDRSSPIVNEKKLASYLHSPSQYHILRSLLFEPLQDLDQ